MTLFRYKILNDRSSRRYHYIDAENLLMAKKRLNELKILASKLSPYESFRETFQISTKTLLYFTKDLYYLLHSNLPLYESLLTIKEKYKHDKIYPMILDITDCVKHGKAFSSILSEYKKSFSSIYVSMIRSAEKSGRLDKAFLELSIMIETNHKWQKKIKDTLLYPAFLLCFAFTILMGLFLFIIPSMAELFEDRTLHPLTFVVLTISNWMCSHLYLLGALCILTIAAIVFCFTNEKVKKHMQSFFYTMPIIKDLATKISIVRFTTSLTNLLESTVPILEALTLAQGTLKHPYLEKDVEKIIDKVRGGEKFSKAVEISTYFPTIVSKMLSTGEHSGSLAPILRHISELFHEEVKTALEKFTALLQPILLLLIGIIVGVVLLAVLIPLTDVSSLL